MVDSNDRHVELLGNPNISDSLPLKLQIAIKGNLLLTTRKYLDCYTGVVCYDQEISK